MVLGLHGPGRVGRRRFLHHSEPLRKGRLESFKVHFRMHLERWSHAAHGPDFSSICADPVVMRFLGGTLAPEDSDASSRRFEEHWVTYGFGLWAIRDTDTGALAGFAGLSHPLWWPDRAGEVEVGWRLARHAWGKGFATRAGTAAIGEARMVLALDELVAYIHPENRRSLAVAARLGFTAPYPPLQHPNRDEPIGRHVLALA